MKLFRQRRSLKRRSSQTLSLPFEKKKKNGIFRSSKKTTSADSPVIEAAITYSLSEDEESCNNIIVSSDIDIENQLDHEELQLDDTNNTYLFDNDATGIIGIEKVDSVETKTSDSSKTEKEDDKTMVFTHLEIMRNELAHMMQLANKDKEIYQLKQDFEEMKTQQTELLASKEEEITRLGNALVEVESALLQAQAKLSSEEKEHSKTIEVLMATQYEFHEFKNKSWFQQYFV